MAANYSEAIFAPVLPKMRAAEVIQSDISSLSHKSTDDVSRQQVLEIELMIKEADLLYRNRMYQSALDKFRTVRAKIYKILYPGFDINRYVVSVDRILPQQAALDKKITELSDKLANTILPLKPDIEFTTSLRTDPVPDSHSIYMKTGLRENKDIEQVLQGAGMNGVALMQNGNFKAAVDVMESALQEAAQAPAGDNSLKAALELNLASSYLQMEKIEVAEKFAQTALRSFRGLKDDVGQSQALYTLGISAQKRGDANGSKLFLGQAAELLKKANTTPGRPAPVTPQEIEREGNGRAAAAAIAIKSVSKVSISPGTLQRINIGDTVDSSTDLNTLKNIQEMKTSTITYRVPGRSYGWGTLPIEIPAAKEQQDKNWRIGIANGDTVIDFAVGAGTQALSTQIQQNIYEVRRSADLYTKIKWAISDVTSGTFYLTQLYSFVLPVKVGDCYAELGQYAKAEEYYLQASTYSYINKNIEGVQLWLKLARNVIEWGNSFYKNEKLPEAKAQYSKIIAENAAVPNSYLYTNAALSVATAQAVNLIQQIQQRPLPPMNWEISLIVLTADAFLLQIAENLDFYGLLLSPIHTFEYLQNVARAHAQQAIQAEREFVNFKNREELEAATRRDLETTVAMAQAEADARLEQWRAAQEDEQATAAAVNLAKQRRDNAIIQRDNYASASLAQVWAQASSMALSGGEDAYWSEIKELADKLDRGETISGPGPKLAAAQTLRSGLKTRDYELKRMQDNINELTAAVGVAENQLQAAQRRTAASEIAYQAALQRIQLSQEALNAFDDEFFTPDSWSKMADVMRDISRNFLFRAIRLAKLMQRAYNFDNDANINIIKTEYGFAVGNTANVSEARLLGGDSLLDDIESFTYLAVTNKTRKSSRIKDVISIASNFPAQFEEFRRTGLLSFETDLYEFDRLHPGFYEQRIEAIEVEVVGVIPEAGLNGTLKAGGVTSFRRKNNTIGQRVHQVDTMALSDFMMRNDVFLYSTETGVRGLFQGFGVGSTFQLHLPKRSNDFDFRRIFDINLVMYYTAKFDANLKQTVLALPVRPGEMEQLYNFAMRYDFPDAWYGFYKNGEVSFQLDRVRLPFNQQNFETKSVLFRLVTKEGISNAGVDVKITAPDGANATATTDANGVVASTDAPLTVLNGQAPTGNWKVQVIDGAPLRENGTVKFDRVYNIQMGLEYNFEYVPETV
jgi:hypothetical protein